LKRPSVDATPRAAASGAGGPDGLYDAYIFDIDGTVTLGDAALPTVPRTIARLRELGRRTLFLSNNTTRDVAGYAASLSSLAIPTRPDEVATAAQVMVRFLQREVPGARLHVLGEAALVAELRAAGFTTTSRPGQVDAVIASFDRGFSYEKLQLAFDAIRHGARFFATNGDAFRPTPTGGQPDAAAVIAAIEACTGARCEATVGKPSPLTAEYACERLGLAPERCIMVGDRLETDIRMANAAGMASALVLTGATAESALPGSPVRPTYVLRTLADLLPEAHR
jgi:arabinose operon protein AraL